jgi:trehalose 6-phosphate phosphatase
MTDNKSTYLLSAAGLAALRDFIDASTLFAFDLDGTLAPIIADPEKIVIEDELRISLNRLNSLAPVAIITGRSCADARSHLRFSPRFLIGNHGAEGVPGISVEEDFSPLCQDWKQQLTQLLPGLKSRGIELEEKGQSLALHYRIAADPAASRKQLQSAVARLKPPPRVVSGIFVKNLTSVDAPHKGKALESLMAHLNSRLAIFVGDDETDEDVFRSKNPAILGIRVGKSEESAARYYLNRQDEMQVLLKKILGYLDKSAVQNDV